MKPKDQILARMYVVLTLLSILPALVGLQVLRIHAYDGTELRQKGSRQASSAQVIPAVRGAILDGEGRTLAVNAARYDLALDPTVPGFAAERSRFITSLSRVTGASRESIARRIDRRRSLKYVMLRRGLREDVKEAIESWNVPGVILEPDYARRYNYGTTLSHVLGHVNSDGNGTAGLELKYNDILRGEDGRRVVKRDRRGKIKVSVDGSV
ncbi:MAG: penicillin-binding protein, partial [Rhodothermia bacterium]|nr:penicillin-binding protein [Rhodothermia bacterium]